MNASDSSQLYLNILNKIKDAIITISNGGEITFFNKVADNMIGVAGITDPIAWMEQFELFKPDSKIMLERRQHPIYRAIRDEKVLNEEYLLQPKRKIAKFVVINSHTLFTNGARDGILLIIQDISSQKETEKKLNSRSKSLIEAYEGLRRAEAGLKMTNTELEKRVLERTQNLTRINKELQSEIQIRLKAEQQIKKNNAELIKTNRDLDNFVYTASHDLKAPISNIEGLINALKEEASCNTTNSNQLIELISISVDKFKQTISDLTEISKVQQSGEDLIEELNIDEILTDTLINIHGLIQTSKAIIKSDFSNCTQIKFSRKNLRSIFYNLLSNAIKYGHPERIPEIFVKAECTSRHIILKVSDNGMGIPPEKKNQIFSMFKRLHDHVGGSGIGLYIVKRIVDNMEGRIEVQTELNKGSSFILYFPKITQ